MVAEDINSRSPFERDRPVALVSVVIPCFRCSATIERAVASIAHQALLPAEVIIVDDASADDTSALLRKLAKEFDGWLKLLCLESNRGAAYARNAGWEMATQPYVAFLDADDAWHPDKLRVQYAYMIDHPQVALCGHNCLLLRSGQSADYAIGAFKVTRIAPIGLIFRNCFSTPTVMLKRQLPFRFAEEQRYAEDLYLWQQVAFSGQPVVRIESPLASIYKAHYGEGGLSSHLWEMEKGEIGNLLSLFRGRNINIFWFAAAALYSLAKYCKRVVVVTLRKRISRSVENEQ